MESSTVGEILRGRCQRRTSRASARASSRYSQVFTFRKRKLILIEHFWDHQEALEAVGLAG
jgi:ketosteroid isomerase-like protein